MLCMGGGGQLHANCIAITCLIMIGLFLQCYRAVLVLWYKLFRIKALNYMIMTAIPLTYDYVTLLSY